MKLSRFSKQIIAVVCSVAMVVAGLVFVPGIDAEAAPDYSGLTYAALGNNQNNEFNQKLYDSEIAVAEGTVNFNVKQYQNAGFNQLYLATGGKIPSTATLNGDDSAVRPLGDQLFIDDAGASLTTYEYNVLDVVFSDSTTAKIIIHLPNNPGGGTYDPAETTTPDPSAPTTTANPWKEIQGGAANQWYYNNTTKQNISSVVNIQKPGWAAEDGVYITVPAGVSQVDVNGVTEGVAAIDGAGFVVYLSALTQKINEVTITQGLGTSYIQIKNENGEDPTVEPSTEAPSESESETVTEAPSESESETVTEAPSESESETETEEPTQTPGHTWFSAANRWVHRQADGSFIAEDGAEYNAVPGLTAAYSGDWGGAELEVANDESDLYTLPVNVIRSGNAGGWTMQIHLNYEGLDNSKVYEIELKSDGNTIFTDTASAVAFYRKTVDIGGMLAVGEHTLTLEATEQEMPPAPVVETITITPRTAAIEENHNIWADWTNPSGTTKSYVYLGQVDNAHAAATNNNGWIFNDNAVQPMHSVDNVAQTRDASIKVQEGQTYTLIVESYDAWDRPTGTGTVQITIPGLTPEEQEIQEYMAKINTSENLALNKTPIVASNQNTAANICDGNAGSRWQADKNIDNTYFAVDLEGVYTVDTVLVSWEASNATDYEIYTAGTDGVYGDTPVATVSGLANNKSVIKLSKNISSNARYVKVVVTGWSDNARGYGISPYELAVFGGEVEGYYDVSDYKSTTPYTYPTKAGKIFAGWFTDDTCIEPYTGTTGIAYAKFIDEDVLGTKFQVANDGSAIRFLSSLDSMDYQSVGFKFTGHYEQAVITEKTKSVEKLYTKINADGTEVLPTVFSDDSTYFFTYTVRGMTGAGTNSDWNVTPFYVTLDGTTVEGTSGVYPQN